jgi:hypothetical protein
MSSIRLVAAGRLRVDSKFAPTRTSPWEALNSCPWLPLPPAGDGIGRDIQRKSDVLLGQSLADGVTLVVGSFGSTSAPHTRLATAPSARAHEPQGQQQYDRSDCGVDDGADDSGPEMNAEAMQEPVANERPDYADCRVADEAEPVALNHLARQPSGNDPDGQNDNQPLVRQTHALPLAFALIRGPTGDIDEKLGRKQNPGEPPPHPPRTIASQMVAPGPEGGLGVSHYPLLAASEAVHLRDLVGRHFGFHVVGVFCLAKTSLPSQSKMRRAIVRSGQGVFAAVTIAADTSAPSIATSSKVGAPRSTAAQTN